MQSFTATVTLTLSAAKGHPQGDTGRV
jgi:hypothetical protein